MILDQAKEHQALADIYRRTGMEKEAHDSEAAAKSEYLNFVRLKKQAAEDVTGAVYGVNSQESYSAALQTLASKQPSEFQKFVKAAQDQKLDPSQYNPGTSALLKQMNAGWKSQESQSKIAIQQAEHERKVADDKAKAEARIARLQEGQARIGLSREALQFQKEKEAYKREHEAEKEKAKVNPIEKLKQSQLADLNKQSTAMNARFAKQWNDLQNMYSTGKIMDVSEFNRRRDELEKTQQREARALATKIRLMGFSPIGGKTGQETAPASSGGVIKLD